MNRDTFAFKAANALCPTMLMLKKFRLVKRVVKVGPLLDACCRVEDRLDEKIR